MTYSELCDLLSENQNAGITLTLPDGSKVPPHFHITEVGASSKKFVDCGGTEHHENTCTLQVWLAHDYNHRIQAGKLARILTASSKLFDSPDVPVEFEHEAPVLTRLPIASYEITPGQITFSLLLKKADCLAKDICLPQPDFSLPDLPALRTPKAF